ncbi:hypothetical protein [Halarchaeum sp. CBA1220]|nr:hypothetical protein [Halarchaeum sp. CBA1220]
MSECTHCGMALDESPVTAADLDGAFCCRGCLDTYRLVEDV